jgi:hypothetical protein
VGGAAEEEAESEGEQQQQQQHQQRAAKLQQRLALAGTGAMRRARVAEEGALAAQTFTTRWA